jgi:hypothetical protein
MGLMSIVAEYRSVFIRHYRRDHQAIKDACRTPERFAEPQISA